MTASPIVSFTGGATGKWAIRSITAVAGAALDFAERLAVEPGRPTSNHRWSLAGSTSNLRYTTSTERRRLQERQAGLDRAEARCAALIPIAKSDAWWAMAQDERLAIYADSRHTQIGMDYLPAIWRRLHHSRDLGEPFDFLTWFDYAPEHEAVFDRLLYRLRATQEWTYVTREIDIRLERID